MDELSPKLDAIRAELATLAQNAKGITTPQSAIERAMTAQLIQLAILQCELLGELVEDMRSRRVFVPIIPDSEPPPGTQVYHYGSPPPPDPKGSNRP